MADTPISWNRKEVSRWWQGQIQQAAKNLTKPLPSPKRQDVRKDGKKS